MKNKSFIVFLLVFCMSILLFSCKKADITDYSSGIAPSIEKSKGEIGLDFVEMHNYVIDSISEQYTPFFFIKDGQFDISGDNQNKLIIVSCTCLDGTTVNDVDLFFSLVLQYIGFNAAEQDFRYVKPSTDETGTFIDFGTVFNTYDLRIKSQTESGSVLRDDYVKKGTKIPIDSRYWSE